VSARALLLAFALALAAAAHAQPVSVQAFADKTTVGDGETLRFTVEVSGPFRTLDRVEPPEVRNLLPVRPAPLQERHSATRGGRTIQTVTLLWDFAPEGSGSAEIGPVAVTVDGRRYTTDPVRIRVVPQRQRPTPAAGAQPDAPAGNGPDLFLRAEPDRRAAYVGQQVVVEYVLYFAAYVHPRNARLFGAWDAAGFWREDLEIPGAPTTRPVMVDGRPYEAVTIKRSAFFPTRAGDLTIDSLVVELEALQSQRAGGVYGPLFNPFASRYARRRLASPSVAVTVRPLPDGAPAAFSGAVGDYTMRVEVDRTEVAAGDAVRVSAIVRGDGNLSTIDGPPWAVSVPLETFPPEVTTRAFRTERRLRGERRFTYAVVPGRPGAHTLPGIAWAYFDPEAGAYRTLTSEPVAIRAVGPAADAEEAARATPEGLVLHAEPGRWRRVRAERPLHTRPAVWAGFALPLLALLAFAGAHLRRQRLAGTPGARSRRALARARATLASGRGDRTAALAALDRAVRDFLDERLDLPARSLPLADLPAALTARGVSEATAHGLHTLLADADAGQFAPAARVPAPSPEDVLRLLADADAEAPLPWAVPA